MTKKVTFIRKAANTVAAKMKDGNIIVDFFKKCSLSYFQRKYYDGFYKEHYEAVKSIVHVFVDLRMNHVILHAPTQSGKTTVMTLCYNVINESESFLALKRYLGIKRIIYLTGDNQCELSEQSMERFRKQCRFTDSPIRLSGSSPCKPEDFVELEKKWTKNNKTPFIMVKNGDCKKFREKVKDFTLNNTLIMVDESHYGTKLIDSQVNKLFQEFGKDFSGDPNKLKPTNTYIMSVSATPYNEEFADKVNSQINGNLLKGIVLYKPGKGYIGFASMYKQGIIQGLKGNSHVTDKTIFTKFLKEQREKMDRIMSETKGQKHAVIMRMQGKKTLITEIGEKGLAKIANKYGFKLMLVDCNNSSKRNIDYENAYKEIEYSQYEGGSNILIIVKQGFSYGISIPDDIKPLISTIYDYRPSYSDSTTDSTEQGLLGRMTGYHPNGLSKYLKIYIAEEHMDGLVSYHCNWPPAESPNPSKKNGEKVQCTYEEWNKSIYVPRKIRGIEVSLEEEKKYHIDCWNNVEGKPLVFNGKIVDDFFKNHSEFQYDSLFNPSSKGQILRQIYEAFNTEILNGRFDPDLIVDARRQFGDDGQNNTISSNLGYSTPILSNSSRLGWRTVDNAKKGREGWAFVIDFRKANGKKGIEIRIPYGNIGFSKDTKVFKERKNYKGYQKSELALAVAAS